MADVRSDQRSTSHVSAGAVRCGTCTHPFPLRQHLGVDVAVDRHHHHERVGGHEVHLPHQLGVPFVDALHTRRREQAQQRGVANVGVVTVAKPARLGRASYATAQPNEGGARLRYTLQRPGGNNMCEEKAYVVAWCGRTAGLTEERERGRGKGVCGGK